MKSKKVFILGFLVFIGVISYFAIFQEARDSSEYDIVRLGISKQDASKKVKTNENYFIIQPELWTTSKGWKIISNKTIFGKIDDVEVKNKEIKKNLPSLVLLNEGNKFLVKGNYDKKSRILEVESWEFVTPIKRDYEHRIRDKKTKKRTNYPKKYIDQFDVDNGDYQN